MPSMGPLLPPATGVAPFSPLSLSPAFWVDFDDAANRYQDSALTTLAVADGDPEGGIKDKSGNGLHILQPVNANRVTLKLAVQNGRAVGRSPGVNQFLSVAGPDLADHTIFMVVRPTLPAGGVVIGNNDVGNTIRYFAYISNSTHLNYFDSTAANCVLSPALVSGATVLLESNRVGTTWRTFLGGVQQDMDKVVSGGAIALATVFNRGGMDVPYTGDICEIVVFPRYLAAGEFTSMRTYLTGRWGL